MTRVLVTWASRHGSTGDIAGAIGGALAQHDVHVEVRPMAEVDTLFPYDAFVVGSAVYFGSWLRDARAFVEEHRELLAERPTWLFSSGPLGHEAASDFDPTDLVATVHAREHRLFDGRLLRSELRLHERVVAGALHIPDGDHRDWPAVEAWAASIGESLSSVRAAREP